MIWDVVIIGGGASGFFCAINIKELNPSLSVLIIEKSDKLLSKVKISGGGRCNVTHNCTSNKQLLENYPRGNVFLEPIFNKFNAKDTIKWFLKKGVKLKVEQDGRMFPSSNSSQTIIDCFMSLAQKHQIKIITKCAAKGIRIKENLVEINSENDIFSAKKLVVATGGYPQMQSYNWINFGELDIKSPVPSLFTFNDKNLIYKHLSGVSVQNAKIKIKNTTFIQNGPILFTHWGLSGPAVIKLSAWAAEYLAIKNYEYEVEINFLNEISTQQTHEEIRKYQSINAKKNIFANPLFDLPKRLWETLCENADISPIRSWAEVGKKNIEKLSSLITQNTFHIKGKTTFKEEFVTCGGVEINQLNVNTLSLKNNKNIYFTGEVLNIDGVTGGFNFQAAWSTAFVVSNAIAATD